MLSFVENYRPNLVIPGEIEHFDRFRSDLGKILGCVSRYNDKDALRQYVKEEEAFFSAVDAETLALLEQHMGVIIRPTEQEGGTVNVVKAIHDMRMECLEEGIAKGIEQGIVAGKAEAIRKMALYFRDQDATLTEEEAVKMAENILR